MLAHTSLLGGHHHAVAAILTRQLFSCVNSSDLIITTIQLVRLRRGGCIDGFDGLQQDLEKAGLKYVLTMSQPPVAREATTALSRTRRLLW